MDDFCLDLAPILRIVGYVIFGIKVATPIILIIVGMIDLAKAVTLNKDEEVKKAQNLLIKKAIAGVLVFLVITIVGLLMGVVGGDQYKSCNACLNNPFSASCPKPDAGIKSAN